MGRQGELSALSLKLPILEADTAPLVSQYNKLKSKYTKLKSRRAHTAISDDDDDGEDDAFAAAAPPHSPAKPLQRLSSHRTVLDSSPESALPFKMNINSANLAHASGSGTQSTAIFSEGEGDLDASVSGKRKRRVAEIIDLCSDAEDEDAPVAAAEDEDEEQEEQDDLFADPFASGSGTWSGFGAGARFASHSPQPKRQRGASTVPMPTLSGSTAGGGPWGPKKVELSKQRSDRHLPDFGAGASVKELGPKAKIKMGARRG